MILWMFGRIQTKILTINLNQRLTKYTKNKIEKKQQPLLLKLVKQSHMYHEFLKIVIMYQTINLIHKYSVCYSVLVDALIHELDVYHMISYVSRVFENCYHVSVNKFNNCAIKCAFWYISTQCVIVFRRCIDTWIWCVSYDFLCITSF